MPKNIDRVLTKSIVVFHVAIVSTVITGLVCSLPLFYVYKIREAYYEGDSVYTVMYVKPEPQTPCISGKNCMPIVSLFRKINLERLDMVTRILIPKAVLFLCLILFIFYLYKIIDHYKYTKYKCEKTNDERTSLEACESDLSLVPAVLIHIVLFPVLICIPTVITYLRYEKIITPPRGLTMRKVLNMFLDMPVNLAPVAKLIIYVIFSPRYRDNFVKLIKPANCCVNHDRYELNKRWTCIVYDEQYSADSSFHKGNA